MAKRSYNEDIDAILEDIRNLMEENLDPEYLQMLEEREELYLRYKERKNRNEYY